MNRVYARAGAREQFFAIFATLLLLITGVLAENTFRLRAEDDEMEVSFNWKYLGGPEEEAGEPVEIIDNTDGSNLHLLVRKRRGTVCRQFTPVPVPARIKFCFQSEYHTGASEVPTELFGTGDFRIALVGFSEEPVTPIIHEGNLGTFEGIQFRIFPHLDESPARRYTGKESHTATSIWIRYLDPDRITGDRGLSHTGLLSDACQNRNRKETRHNCGWTRVSLQGGGFGLDNNEEAEVSICITENEVSIEANGRKYAYLLEPNDIRFDRLTGIAIAHTNTSRGYQTLRISNLEVVSMQTKPQGEFAASPTPSFALKAPTFPTKKPESIAVMVESLTPKGWELYDKVMRFTPENLYEQINGRAEYYLAYDVIGMTFASFVKTIDNGTFIDLSIYDMGKPTNAFGVFSGERPLEAHRLKLGHDAYRVGANHYIFQGQYYIQIIAADDTDELRQVCTYLAEKVTDFLQDSGQPEGSWVVKPGVSHREKVDIWGLKVLPETDRVPQSVKYFLVDALGLDFMRNTYTAKYYKGKSIVSVFLSQQDSPESARETVAKFKEHAKVYSKGVDILSVDGIELLTCDMGRGYDVVFQKDYLVAGVTEVKDRKLAVEATIDLWKQLQTE